MYPSPVVHVITCNTFDQRYNKMLIRIITFLTYGYHFLSANAWSTSSIKRGINRQSVTRYGSILANIGGLHSASSLYLASGGDGECAVTPEIPVATTPSTIDTSTALSRKPKSGDIVTFTLLRFQPQGEDDEALVLEPLFDTTGALQVVLNGGNYLPGLHKLLSTMNPGETINGATIDAGYGAYNSELSFDISTSDIGDSIGTSSVKIGTVLRMGNGMECRGTEISNEKWTLDANHPLAGASYEVDVKLEMVEEGPTNWEYVGGDVNSQDRYKVATFALGCFWGGGKNSCVNLILFCYFIYILTISHITLF